MKIAYMLFSPESPLVGLRDHPAFAPQPAPETFDAEGWAAAYNAFETQEAADAELASNKATEADACESEDDDDLEDETDITMRVGVCDDGDLVILSDEDEEIARYTAKQIYEDGFSMDLPSITKLGM
jgi:hypothetical protein